MSSELSRPPVDSNPSNRTRPANPNIALSGTRVLITGGLGFLGSSLARRLVEHDAEVLVVDAMLDGCGGNRFNLEGVFESLRYDVTNVCDVHAMKQLVRGQDIVYHLAGQVSHIKGLDDPHPDLEVNVRSTMVLLEALRRYNPSAKLISSSTRSVYAPEVSLPVHEDAPTRPTGLYEWSKLSSEHLVSLYHDLHGIDTVIMRLSNIFGPRGQMARAGAGIANWFCRRAIQDQPLHVFGDGSLKRDFLYVDDAVEAMALLAVCEKASGTIVNLGREHATTLSDLAHLCCEIAEGGQVTYQPFPREWRVQQPRDYVPSLERIKSLIPWSPNTTLRDGLESTIGYYREFKHHYWT